MKPTACGSFVRPATALSYRFLIWLLFLFVALVSFRAVADCQQQLELFNQHIELQNERSIKAKLDHLLASGQCTDTDEIHAKRVTATRLFSLAYEAQSVESSATQVRQLMLASEEIYPTWRTLSFLGLQDHRQQRYTDAARRLQAVLVLLDDPVATPQPPPVDTIRKVHQIASEALMLAPQFVPPPKVRGVSSGVLAVSVRGFSVRRTPLPISFQTASTQFTSHGEKALQSLHDALRSQSGRAVEIVGHADERGDSAFNLELSIKRAEKVRDWLVSQGVEQKITTSGRGESEPLELVDSDGYTQEQIWQLNRRVELRRERALD